MVCLFGLNLKVTTSQGVNYVVTTKKIPLYLKMLDFFDRHFNYIELTRTITAGCPDENERIQKIFEWAYRNINKNPQELPVIDDHVWHIIVRGYGTDDQITDAFTTLCAYAGHKSYFTIYDKGLQGRHVLAFVEVDKEWRIFNPSIGVFLKNKRNDFATYKDIASGAYEIFSIEKGPPEDYDKVLKDIITSQGTDIARAEIQSPLNRLKHEIRKWMP